MRFCRCLYHQPCNCLIQVFCIFYSLCTLNFLGATASQVALVVENPPANAGGIRDMGSIPGSGRSPGGGHDNPLQYSFLENPMDRGVWSATLHGVAKSWTRLKRLSMHTHTHLHTHTHTEGSILCLSSFQYYCEYQNKEIILRY